MQDGHVERATSKIVHQHVLAIEPLILTVGNDGRGRLGDDVDHPPSGRLDGVLYVGSLVAVERRGHREHDVAELSPSLFLGTLANVLHQVIIKLLGRDNALLALPQQFERRMVLLVRNDFERPVRIQLLHFRIVVILCHQPLELVDRAFQIARLLSFCFRSNQKQTVATHHRRNVAVPILVTRDDRLAIGVRVGSGRKRGSQVETNRILLRDRHETYYVKHSAECKKSSRFLPLFSVSREQLLWIARFDTASYSLKCNPQWKNR